MLLASSGGLAEGTPPPQPGATAADPGGPVVELRVAGRKPVGGLRTVRGVRGQTILLKLSADEKMTIHVHGYDVRREIVPGPAVTVPIEARWTGRFPVTAHLEAVGGRHAPEPTLLYLEVHPE